MCALAAIALVTAAELNAEIATYRLEVNNTWSVETHPPELPTAAHFSWLGGGTHNDQVSFWQEGELASPGMVQIAETGVINIWMDEIDAEVGRGNAFKSMPWRWWFCPESINNGNCGETTVKFDIDSDFPLVTLATMLGPSPDWFVGVTGLPLHENGTWLSPVVVDLRPYDGGTRSANVWELFGPRNDPPEPIALITEEFGQLIGPASLGTMTFTLISAPSAVLEEHTTTLPESFSLEQNYPNPFNSQTTIHFALPQDTDVELIAYDLVGQQVATLVQGARQAGVYTVHWDGTDTAGRPLASGMYLYRLRAGQQVETRKLLLLH